MNRLLYIGFTVLVSLWFARETLDLLTYRVNDTDAAQNARIAYHLVHTGVWGYDQVETPTPKPTMRREPLPILVIAAELLLLPEFAEPYTIADITRGRLAKSVKLVNVFWRFWAALFLFLLCWELFCGPIVAGTMALLSLIASDMLFFSSGNFVDRIYTEIPASALLLAVSWAAVRFVRIQSRARAISLGIALGLLVLTKAALLYVSVGFVAMLFLLDRLNTSKDAVPLKQIRQAYAVAIVAFLITIAPWVIRNAIQFREPQIATRAEHVLGLRMLLTEQPLLGVIYASSPQPLRAWMGPHLGYAPADLDEGGKLDGIKFVKKRRGEIYKTRMETEGYTNVRKWLLHAMLTSIVNDPLRYLASVVVFAYRGMWFMHPSAYAEQMHPMLFYALSAAALLCFFGVFLGGLIARNKVLVSAFGLGVGYFLFHSALSHSLPRYNAPLTPLVIIAVFWLCYAAVLLTSRSLNKLSPQRPKALPEGQAQ